MEGERYVTTSGSHPALGDTPDRGARWVSDGCPAGAQASRTGLEEDSADIKYVQIGALAGTEAAVPSALLRSRKVTISGSGAGSVPAAEIKAKIPAFIELIANGSVQVPYRTFPLSRVSEAWTASAESGPRVVLVPD